MSAEEAYRWLTGASITSAYDPFDIHIVAAILAVAISEARDGERGILDGIGLGRPAFLQLAGDMFPSALGALDGAIGDPPMAIDDEEQSVRDILGMYASGASRLERYLAAMIARRCQSPHHLWQDLGLRNRGELSMLMKRHFVRLSEKNQHDMKWKKFLYRLVCGSESFTLCTSPVCSECNDFANCFGAEDGESRLAQVRNAPHVAA